MASIRLPILDERDADVNALFGAFWKHCQGVRALFRPPVISARSLDAVRMSEGLPASGVLAGVWRAGRSLMAELSNVPADLAWLAGQGVAKVAVEIGELFDNAGTNLGLCIRRIALTGPGVPVASGLESVAFNDFPRGKWIAFAEGSQMNVHVFKVICPADFAPALEAMLAGLEKARSINSYDHGPAQEPGSPGTGSGSFAERRAAGTIDPERRRALLSDHSVGSQILREEDARAKGGRR